MSGTIGQSSPEGAPGQQPDLSTPTRREPASQRKRNQRPHTSHPKAQDPTPTHEADKDIALGGTGDESQDSAPPPNSSSKHQKRRNKNSTPRHGKDHTKSFIPPVDGTVSPRPQPGPRVPNPHATPNKQAYAGPTFHASPAPSSLPMPKLFSKSVPAASQHSALQARFDDDVGRSHSHAQNSEEESTDSRPEPPRPRREESPLDYFFKADRAEKARQRASGGSPSMATFPRQSLTPASTERATQTSGARSASGYDHLNRPRSGGYSERAMFMMELDGTGESEVSEDGRPPVTPFRERLGAARSTSSLFKTETSQTSDEEERLAKTQALKRLLMKQGSSMQSSDPESPGQAQYNSQTPEQHAPQPPAQEVSTAPAQPRQPTAPMEQAASDIRAMENDLRKILKMDP